MEKEKKQRPVQMEYKSHRYAAPVGGIFVFLAVIGLVALVYFGVQFTSDLLDNSSEKRRFEQIILPVLMLDPVPFEHPTDVDNLFLLQSSLWSTLLGEKRDSYEYDSIGRLVIPASDLDVTCARLYGPDVKLTHQSFGDYETSYVFDVPTQTYNIPLTGQTGYYTPSVVRVVKKGDTYTLTVGYVPPSNIWTLATQEEGAAPQADKYMVYELVRVNDYYRVTAIRDVPADDPYANAGVPGVWTN